MALYLTGDIHGDAADLAARATACGAASGDEILVLGDVGLLYGSMSDGAPRLASPELADLAGDAPWRLVVMRGNHDARYERDLLAWDAEPVLGFGPARETEWRGGRALICEGLGKTLFLPDAGGLYDIDGVRVLIAPGAYSVDKSIRLSRGWSWEPEEQLTYGELDALLEIAERKKPQVVLSHTCPLSWYRWIRDMLLPGVEADYRMEHAFDTLLDIVRPELERWCFGHFHGDRGVEGGLGRLFFRDIAEFGSVVEGNILGTARADYDKWGDPR